MKAATIFMLSAVLVLFFCLTTQGRNYSGKRHGKSGLTKRTQHGDSPGSLQGGRRHAICNCDQKTTYNLPRRTRRMSAHHKRHMCARICMSNGGQRGFAVPIPLI